MPEVHIPRARVPTIPSEGSGGGGGTGPASGRREKLVATVWVGAASTGAELAVLVDPRGAVVNVWAATGIARLEAIEEAVRQGGGGSSVRVVIDASTSQGRLLATAVRERTKARVEEALADRPLYAELRTLIDQGVVVFFLLELVKVARVNGREARRLAGALTPALEEMQRPAERAASIPQTPRPPPWTRIGRAALRALFVLVCLVVGVGVAYAIQRHHLSLGR